MGVSRGLGTEQRRVLRVLTEVAEEHGDAWVLLRSLAGQDPTWEDGERTKADKSRFESTRRAVRTLVERGLAESNTTGFAGRTHAIARLRQESPPDPLPRYLDDRFSFHLRAMDNIHNDVLRRLGSNYRKVTVARSPWESARLFVPSEPDQHYHAVYLYPSDSADDDRWHLRAHDLAAAADEQSRGAIDNEVQRRVEAELSRRAPTACAHCAAVPDVPQPSHRSVKEMSDLELAIEMGEQWTLYSRDILLEATRRD